MKNLDPHAHATAITAELEKLQGRWKQTRCEAGGAINPPDEYEDGSGTTFNGNTFVVWRADGTIVIEGTFALDPTREPKTVDWTDTFGTDAGKTFPAIYALDGDQLIFCAGDEGRRPTEFRTGKGEVLRIHQRETP